VRPLLRYSTRAAYDLTARARAAADATENQQIANMKAEGKSNRQIGRELGIDEGTVRYRGKACGKMASAGRTIAKRCCNGAWRPTAAIGGSAVGWNGGPPSFDATRCGRSATG
jgi:DNA-binding CsgD family transcriptional regulator